MSTIRDSIMCSRRDSIGRVCGWTPTSAEIDRHHGPIHALVAHVESAHPAAYYRGMVQLLCEVRAS